MHLQQVKDTTGPDGRTRSWGELAAASGIPKSNLILIARGERGWDSETAAKLRLIGVDLNQQSEVLAKKRGWPIPQKLAS
jgi:hypothetical protein